MKKIIFLFLVILNSSIIYCFAQNSFASLLHKSYARRFMQLDSLFYDDKQVYKDSASFFKAADDLATLAKREGDNELYLEAQFIKWRFYPRGNIRQNAGYVETKLGSLLKEAVEKDLLHLQIRIMDNLGLYYYTRGNYGAAVEQYLNAYYLLRDIPLHEFPNKRDFVYNDIASIYLYLEDYDNAGKFLREADTLPVFPVPRFTKMRGVINVSNTLGMIYRNTSRWDSAEYYFHKARSIAAQEKDTIWIGIAGGNIGITYFFQKKYAEAIPFLEKDIELSIKGNEYHNAANSCIKLAEIYLIRKNKAQAWKLLQQARALTAITYEQYKLLNNLFPLISKFYAGEGNMSLAYRYADSAKIMSDSAFMRKDKIALARAQQKIAMAHHLAEVQQLQAQQKLKTVQRNSLLGTVVLLIVVTLLLIGRQRLLKKQKQYAEDKERAATKELDGAKRQLQNFTHNIREKNELIDRLKIEMHDLQASTNKEALEYRQLTLEKLEKTTLFTEEHWRDFQVTFETAYPGWLQRLKEKMPGLTAADLRFLTLSKLKLSAREMAHVLGISPNSIRMSRHRLKKKYNLAEEETLELITDKI